MRARHLTAAFASAIVLAACGGGGSTGPSAPAMPVAPAVPTAAPQSAATIPMSLSIPRRTSSAAERSPQFLSPSLGSIAFYDGPMLIYVANMSLDSVQQFSTVYSKSGSTTVAPGSCTFTSAEAICNLTVTSTVGQHAFDIIAYPGSQGQRPQSAGRAVSDVGTPPAFTGVISSQGELSVNLAPGTNPGQTLTNLGVADRTIIAGPSNATYNVATQFGYQIQDSTRQQIVQPGATYDNGPVTITAAPPGMVTISPNSIAAPPTTAVDQFFNVTCINASGGPVTISLNARTTPNATYASGLTYSGTNYAPATIGTASLTCDPASATIPIKIQGRHA